MSDRDQPLFRVGPRPRCRWPLVVFVILLGVTFWLGTVPAVARMPQVHRWVLHFSLLVILTTSLVGTLRLSLRFRRGRLRELLLGLVLALIGEASQVFFPLHDPEYKGLIANVCCVLVALTAISVVELGVRTNHAR
jgi:VanZ family protein